MQIKIFDFPEKITNLSAVLINYFSMFQAFIQSIMDLLSSMNYLSIFILMILESSLIPLPSELILIPAWVSAANGNIDPFIAAFVWWLGALLGATFNYYVIGKYLGKPFLWKYGKYFLIKHEEYHRAEKLFLENANLYTFLGRLTPVIRQVIPIPAWVFGMKLTPFLILTFIGATLWCGILIWVWYFFGNAAIDIFMRYLTQIAYVVLPLIAIYIWWKIWGKKRKK
jgi:membrane protein DedA with SNARE-associated domain